MDEDIDDIDNTDNAANAANDMQAVLRGFVEAALPFARDTTLPPGLLEQYTVGRLLREPTFCDTSYHVAGLVAPHRYLVISALAVPLDDEDNPDRGLCVLQNDALLKVIDRVEAGDRAQVTLLHVPEPNRSRARLRPATRSRPKAASGRATSSGSSARRPTGW